MEQFQYNVDPSGWWIMNIPRGIRASWDGTSFKHYETKYPMPSIPLDGILQHKSGDIQQLLYALKTNWTGVTFVVFDTETNKPFETRISMLHELKQYSHITVAPYKVCLSLKHLYLESHSVWLIVPNSKYKKSWFKVNKLTKESGKIIKITIKSYITLLVKHKDIIVPLILPRTTQIPTIGSLITYEYNNLSSVGIPIFPRISDF